jgi:hypothetical protein
VYCLTMCGQTFDVPMVANGTHSANWRLCTRKSSSSININITQMV